MIELFRTCPNFLRFWLSQATSQIGDRIHSLALIWLVYKWSNSALAVGMILIATSLPGILISPLAGILCDRFSRRKIMIIADLVRSAVVAWVAWQSYTNALDYNGLICATVVIAMAAAFFNPAALALIPNLVERGALTRANAASQLVAGLSAVIGPLFGSALIATIGVPMAFGINSISFIVSALLIFLVHEQPMAQTSTKPSFLGEMRAGREALRQAPLITALLVPIMVINFFFAAIPVVLPVLAEGIFQAGATGLGILMSCFGGGMFIGSLLLSMARQQKERTVTLIGFSLMGCCFPLIALSQWLPLTGLGLLGVGIGLSIVNITLITIFQKLLDDSSRGKIMALVTGLALSLQPIAYGVMGIATEILKPAGALLAGGAVILLVTFYLASLKLLKEV
ncbi:MAG: MFS transporter [Desulfuromonadaceae bacterium]|nr:MFS transporter [Desulfuromonas sp.]MDY0185430.1 MFS transporter [Desulfuromonadaceae bacterium]